VNAGEFTAAKGMKGVRRDERDGGREKRAGRREAGERGAGEGILCFVLRTLSCIYSSNYVHLTTRFNFFFR
jgi:hypothetical protein